jgi:hypothetical protein
VAAARPDVSFRHWGDADVGGLRIWQYLRKRLSRPVSLYRTTAEWVEQLEGAGQPLRASEAGDLAHMAEVLVSWNEPEAEDVPEVQRLIAVLIRRMMKVEQERY